MAREHRISHAVYQADLIKQGRREIYYKKDQSGCSGNL